MRKKFKENLKIIYVLSSMSKRLPPFILSKIFFSIFEHIIIRQIKKKNNACSTLYKKALARKFHANLDYREWRWYQVNKFLARESRTSFPIFHTILARENWYIRQDSFVRLLNKVYSFVGDFLREQFAAQKKNRNRRREVRTSLTGFYVENIIITMLRRMMNNNRFETKIKM